MFTQTLVANGAHVHHWRLILERLADSARSTIRKELRLNAGRRCAHPKERRDSCVTDFVFKARTSNLHCFTTQSALVCVPLRRDAGALFACH